MDSFDIPWLAGLFEAEGSMSITKRGGINIRIAMTDRDVIERVQSIFPCNGIATVDKGSGYKTQYLWQLSDQRRVRQVLEAILPWFGERRSARAAELLEHLRKRPGKAYWHTAKTHCPQGHPYDEQNTYVRPRGGRVCRACARLRRGHGR